MSKRSQALSRATPNAPGFALQSGLLFVLILATYCGVWRYQFIWDDDSNITESHPLRSLPGLAKIWFHPGATQQYYPLTHSSFWLDYHLWGLNAGPYHVENVLLHAAGAWLLFIGLRKLNVKGAWLGAAFFALHPLNAESVAWVTERKNTLSGVLFFASLLAAVKFWKLDAATDADRKDRGDWKYYFLACGLCLFALFAKTATVGIPVIIGLLIWWKRGRVGVKDFALLLPMIAMGVGMALITMRVERNHLGVTDAVMGGVTGPMRLLVAGRALWFYLGKVAWPYPLMFIYPRWTVQSSNLLWYLPIVAAIALAAVCWRARNGWGRHALMAFGWYFVIMFPIIGLFNGSFFMYSFVSDHFQYLAGVGPLALAAAAITIGTERLFKNSAELRVAIPGACVLCLCALSWRHSGVFRDLDSLWTDTLKRNPDCWMAQDNYGTLLSAGGQFDAAAGHYRQALALNPDDLHAYNDLGMDFARRGDVDAAITNFDKALAIMPGYVMGHYNLGRVLLSQNRTNDAITHLSRAAEIDPEFSPAHFSLALAYEKKGDLDAAISEFSKTLELEPDSAAAEANLGRVLAAQGKADEALQHYRKALQLDPSSAEALANLGNEYFHQGKYGDAVNLYGASLKISPDNWHVHYNLALTLDRLGKHAEAQTELATAQRLKDAAPR